MRHHPRILLDVDGPLTSGFLFAACAVLRDLGIDAHAERVDRWDPSECFNVPPDVTEEMYRRLKLAGVAINFEPHPYAREFVAELQEWADVWAVTAPLGGPNWAHERELWCRDVMGIPLKNVISARNKIAVAGDALVDDKLKTIIAWGDAHPTGLSILWREAHNARERWCGPQARNYDELRAWLFGLRPESR